MNDWFQLAFCPECGSPENVEVNDNGQTVFICLKCGHEWIKVAEIIVSSTAGIVASADVANDHSQE